MSISTDLTNWWSPVTKPDIESLAKAFNETHSDVKAELVPSNSDGVLRIYITTETHESITVTKSEMEYSEFLNSKHPLLAIAFRMEEVYREALSDEKESRGPMPTVGDIRDIARTFDMLHPGISCAMGFDHKERVLEIYLVKGKNVTENLANAFTRTVSYNKILNNSDPLKAVKGRLEQAYLEFAMENSNYGPDLTGIVQDFTQSHPDIQIHFRVVKELDAIKMRVQTRYGLRVDRMISRTDISSVEEPASFITAVLEDAYKELMKQCSNKEEEEMPTKGKSITDAIAVDNGFMMKMAKCAVAAWYNMHNGPRKIKPEDVYVVWFCKTLQNWKAMCSTDIPDGMYYEVTYDGDKDVAYVDAYKKWDNESMLGENLRHDVLATSVTLKMTTEEND